MVFFGFGVLGGIFPFHSWAPDGHVAAPTAISMLLAGVEMKVGGFAAFGWHYAVPGRCEFMGAFDHFTGNNQCRLRRLDCIGPERFQVCHRLSSVSHMGLVMFGFATLPKDGMIGAGMQMFSHGVMTAMFFAIVGMVYDRAHTRDMELGGFFKMMPFAGIGFIIAGLVSMGMPGFSGFAAEFPIFMGLWSAARGRNHCDTWSDHHRGIYFAGHQQGILRGDPRRIEKRIVGDVAILDKVTIVIIGHLWSDLVFSHHY